MNGDEVVYECLRKHGSDAEGERCLQCCGADEELQEILREFDAEETQTKARQVLRKYAVDRAMEEARERKAALDSIAESPMWKDPQVLNKLSREFAVKDLKKSRETTKHYVDNAGPPATGPKSLMGNPKKGADGRVLLDARGVALWDSPASEEQQNANAQGVIQGIPASQEQQNRRIANHLRSVQGSGALFPDSCRDCSAYPGCTILGDAIDASGVICDQFAKKGTGNMSADGRIDPRKSIMGNPVRQADGSYKWVST